MNDEFGVSAELSRQVFAMQGQLRGAFRDSLRVGARLGKLLDAAKAACRHGDFLNWLTVNFEGSPRQAQRFMLLAREYPNPDGIPALSLREALKLIAGKRAKEKTFFAHERVSRHIADVVLENIARVLPIVEKHVVGPLELEGLTTGHRAMKLAIGIEGELRRLRELVQTLRAEDRQQAQTSGGPAR